MILGFSIMGAGKNFPLLSFFQESNYQNTQEACTIWRKHIYPKNIDNSQISLLYHICVESKNKAQQWPQVSS